MEEARGGEAAAAGALPPSLFPSPCIAPQILLTRSLARSLGLSGNVPFMGVPKLHEHTPYQRGLPACGRGGDGTEGLLAPISL